MGMTAFELFGVLKLDKSDFDKGMKDASSNASSFGSKIGSGLASAVGVGVKAIGAATAAATTFAGTAVAVGSSFDAAMGSVAATAGKSVDELSAELGEVDTAYGHFSGTLRDFALYMGQNTTFSATQAANALNYMALAGYSTQESMEMLPSVLSMAAAGGMDLALASDMITDTQSALGLSFERTGDMVNEFAKAASTGNTSVEQLGEAMLRVGGLGAELNGGFITLADGTQAEVDNVQELEIAFTAMANAGVKGSEAGTHMRNMLLKLASPTDDGAAAFEALGVTVFDDTGKMRSLSEIFGGLSDVMNKDATPAIAAFYDKFKGMSEENILKEFEKAPEDFELFGISVVDSTGHLKDFDSVMAEANEKLKDGLDQESKLQAISDIFNTRDVAAAEALLNAVDQDWNRIGEAILQADGAADEMSKTKLDNLTGDMTLFKSALETAQITINDQLSPTLRQFVQLGTTGLQEVTNAFNEGGLEGAMEAFGSVLSDGLKMVVDLLPTAIDAGTQLLGALGQGIIDNLPTIVDAAVQIVVQLSQGLVQALPELAQGAITLIQSLAQSFSENKDSLLQVGSDLLTMLWDGITTGLPMLVEGAVDVIGSLSQGITDNLPQMLETGLNALMEFSGSLRENAGLLIDAGLDMIVAIAEGLIEALPTMIETIPTIVSNIAGIINDNAPKLIATGIELIGKLVAGIVQAVPTLIAEFPKILKAIFDVITAFNWVDLGKHIITFIANGVKSLATTIPNLLKNFGQNAANMIKNIDWYKVGSSIINFLTNGIKALTNQIPGAIRAIMNSAVNLIKSINWLELGINIVSGIASGIGNAAHLIWDAVKNAVSGAWDAVTSFFQISSPSKKMMWAGKMLDEGFAKGIEQSAGLVSDAMDDVSVLPEFDVSTAPSQPTNTNASNNIVMNIYGAVGQPIEELADIVAERINNATKQQIAVWS